MRRLRSSTSSSPCRDGYRWAYLAAAAIASCTRGEGGTVDSFDEARQRTWARPAAREYRGKAATAARGRTAMTVLLNSVLYPRRRSRIPLLAVPCAVVGSAARDQCGSAFTQLLDARDAEQLHGASELFGEQADDFVDTGGSPGDQTPQVGTPNERGVGTER